MRRERIQNAVSDLVANFLYYDRKEDEDLPGASIDEAVAGGEVSAEEIIAWFREELTKRLGDAVLPCP